jgi:hypothetical protein
MFAAVLMQWLAVGLGLAIEAPEHLFRRAITVSLEILETV